MILTGGLGPTNDDITKHVLCEFFQDKLVFNSDVLDDIKALFTKRDRRINYYNKQQAMVFPTQCQLLRNSKGTAPWNVF